MAKSSLFGKMKGDDLAIVTLQNVMKVKSSYFFPLTQTQPPPQKNFFLNIESCKWPGMCKNTHALNSFHQEKVWICKVFFKIYYSL